MRESELLSRISSAKEEVSMASNTLRAMIRAFKQSQLYMTPTRGPTDLGTSSDPDRISTVCAYLCKSVVSGKVRCLFQFCTCLIKI